MKQVGLFFLLIVLVPVKGLGQTDSIPPNSLYLSIDNLNFIKNNEYFNNIADGYTLLGSYLHPKISFHPSSNSKLELGVFGLTYAGLDDYHRIIPTFSFTYFMKDAQLTMGTLHQNKGHGLIAPLMAFESQLDERSIENGLQYELHKDKFTLDTWLNWEHFIFKGATKNEELVMGISTKYTLLDSDNWSINIPFQNLFYHRGGQINTNETQDRVVFTMRHTAIGCVVQNKFSGGKKLEFNTFFMQNKSGNIPQEYIFTSGYGSLSHISYTYKNWKLGIGYWYGNQFVSPKGDDMFQSASVKTDIHYENGILQPVYSGHTEPERSLFLGDFSYHKIIAKNIVLGFTVQTYFQNYASSPTPDIPDSFTDNQLDYSMGLYIHYKDVFKLMK